MPAIRDACIVCRLLIIDLRSGGKWSRLYTEAVVHDNTVRIVDFDSNGPLHSRRMTKRRCTARHDNIIMITCTWYYVRFTNAAGCRSFGMCVNTLYVVSMWVLVDCDTEVSIVWTASVLVSCMWSPCGLWLTMVPRFQFALHNHRGSLLALVSNITTSYCEGASMF